ncbi:MAG: DNA recombination protein RmuC [Rubricella sp.]
MERLAPLYAHFDGIPQAVNLLGGALIIVILGALWWVIAARRTVASLRAQAHAARSESQAELAALRTEATRSEERLAALDARLADRAEEIDALRDSLDAERRAAGDLRVELERLRTENAKDRDHFAREEARLRAYQEDMKKSFQTLSQDVLRIQGEDFRKANQERLEAMLTPLREHVGKFETELRTVHQSAAKERQHLQTVIEGLTKQTLAISAEAENLTRALKGDRQKQGAWGEMVLEKILEASGLIRDEHYHTQSSGRDAEGRLLRPDVVVDLPEGRRLVIDSKVSLSAYERLVNAEDDVARAAALKDHVRAVRAHIETLAGKDYSALSDGSVDFVVLFMPIEGAFATAISEAGDLTAEAVSKGVTLATPTTLMMALRTVENVWAIERRNRNAEEIARRAGLLYDKVAGFAEEMEKVGGLLDRARDSHDRAWDRLSRGNGSVLRQVELLKTLGARTQKSLPGEVPPAVQGEDDDPPALPGAAE